MKHTHEFKRITYICQLCFSIFKVPIAFIDSQGEVIRQDFYNQQNPLVHADQIPQALFPDTSLSKVPHFVYTEYYENYFAINVIFSNYYQGKIIVGPAISSEMNQLTIDSFFSNFKNSTRLKAEVIKYYARLPIVDIKLWADFSRLLYFLLYHEKVDILTLASANFSSTFNIEENLESYLAKKKQEFQIYQTEQFTKGLIKAVKEGSRAKLLEQISKPLDGIPGVHAKNLLRSEKNLFISSVTLFAQAAVEGGLDWDLALNLRDIYVQKVEELQEVQHIYSLYYTMLCDYTDRVHAIRTCSYSKSVTYAIHYISKHLYTKLSLPEISNSLNLNASYLSQLFKKEVGIPISKYIQIEKIKEAKKLLLNHSQSILNICVLLNFNDQSYFTKVFKEHTGVTPSEYRQQSPKI